MGGEEYVPGPEAMTGRALAYDMCVNGFIQFYSPRLVLLEVDPIACPMRYAPNNDPTKIGAKRKMRLIRKWNIGA